MKKLNLLNSLIFALALQSSVGMMAVTEQELIESYKTYQKDGSNKQELVGQIDEMIASAESYNHQVKDGIYSRLQTDLGIDIRQLRSNLQSSLFNKKNMAIAAVGALAVYEVWKATQAYKNLTGKNFFNEIVNLHKNDANAIAGLAKSGFAKVRSISPKQVAKNSLAKVKTGASNLRDASVDVAKSGYNKALVLGIAAKGKLQDTKDSVANGASKLYRRFFPIKSVVDTSFSPVGNLSNSVKGLISRSDEAYNLAQQSFPGELTSRELGLVSRLNDIQTQSQFNNLASATSKVAALDNFDRVAELTSKAANTAVKSEDMNFCQFVSTVGSDINDWFRSNLF